MAHTNTAVTVDLGNGDTARVVVEDTYSANEDTVYAIVGNDRYVIIEEHCGVYSIPASRRGDLAARFAKIAKKAAKIGCEAPSYTVIAEDYVDRRTEAEKTAGNPERLEKVYFITVNDVTVKYDGWRFLGTIESATAAVSGTYLVNMVPGEVIPSRFRDRDSVDPLNCDHCGHRRFRKETFIVANDASGEVAQVGRTCLRDFVGHSTPANIASYMQYLVDLTKDLNDDEEGGFGYGGGEYCFKTLQFLTIVRAVMRQEGWVSRGMARNSYEMTRATADIAWDILTPTSDYQAQKMVREWLETVSDADKDFAEKALEYAPTLWADAANTSDYIFNLQGALSNGIVTAKTSGIAASLLFCYAKHLEIEITKKAAANNANEHMGSVGERITVKATITKVSYHESDWGTTSLITFLTAEGNTLVWWYSGSTDYEVAERYSVTGTVKKHGEYKGTNTTTLSRCSCQELGVAYVKLTKKQMELTQEKVHDNRIEEAMWTNKNLLCVPLTDTDKVPGLVEWLNTQGRIGKGVVTRMQKSWDVEEMGAFPA